MKPSSYYIKKEPLAPPQEPEKHEPKVVKRLPHQVQWVMLSPTNNWDKLSQTVCKTLEDAQILFISNPENASPKIPLTIKNHSQIVDFHDMKIFSNETKASQPLHRNCQFFQMLGITLVVCKNSKGQQLCVKETNNRGWWIPGGLVDPPETFYQAAVRETKEEAGLDVTLKGILRFEQAVYHSNQIRLKAEPNDESKPTKTVPDEESEEGKWLSIEEIIALKEKDVGWRGPEILQWPEQLEKGGAIYPLSILTHEGGKVEIPKKKSEKVEVKEDEDKSGETKEIQQRTENENK